MLYNISYISNIPFVLPEFIQINVTTRCNLRCKICNAYRFPSKKQEELTTQEIREVIRQADNWGIKRVIFSGGEPFLREDIFEICDFIKTKTRMLADITTNATLIGENIARKIIEAGIHYVQISLDGVSSQTHDAIRGEGSFEKTLNAIRILNQLRNKELGIGISFTVNRFNYQEILPLLDLGRQLKINHILFIPFIEDNTYRHGVERSETFLLERNNLGLFKSTIEKVLAFRKKYSEPVIVNFENLALYERYFSGELKSTSWKCFAGFRWVQINPTGNMSMCGREYGSIRDTKKNDLKSIWYSKKAREARIKIKKCRQLCLQPCMGKP